MNPFDLTGPEFLLFYLAWGIGGLLLAGWLRSSRLHRFDLQVDARAWFPGYYPQDSEAYAVALLRGGPKEAIRTLLARLVAGGFATVANGEIQKIPAGGASPDLLPIERKALAVLGGSQPANEAVLTVESAVEPELLGMENDLARQGLILSAEQKKALRNLQVLALLLIVGLGITKLVVAIGRGKTNIGFLLLLLGLYTLAVALFLKPPRVTPTGRSYLDWIRESHEELAQRVAHGRTGEISDMTFAAAFFGATILPTMADLNGWGPRHRLAEQGNSTAFVGYGGDFGGSSDGGSSDGGSSDGGSSDGGSSGGGGGGGCGGGGCGGCGGS